MISSKLKNAIKLSPEKAYVIARKAGILPCTLSKIINNIDPIRKGDSRVIAVGRILGVPADECFESIPRGDS